MTPPPSSCPGCPWRRKINHARTKEKSKKEKDEGPNDIRTKGEKTAEGLGRNRMKKRSLLRE